LPAFNYGLELPEKGPDSGARADQILAAIGTMQNKFIVEALT
jgi:hypothetical protein